MRKHDGFRAAIVAANPSLATDPNQLSVFIDKGRLAVRHGPALGFEYRYRLICILTDFAGDPDSIILPALLWIRDNQPDLILNHNTGDEALTFDVIVLNAQLVDLSIEMNLTEAVDVKPREGGGYELTYKDEPKLDGALVDVPLGALVGEIWSKGELLCVSPDREA